MVNGCLVAGGYYSQLEDAVYTYSVDQVDVASASELRA